MVNIAEEFGMKVYMEFVAKNAKDVEDNIKNRLKSIDLGFITDKAKQMSQKVQKIFDMGSPGGAGSRVETAKGGAARASDAANMAGMSKGVGKMALSMGVMVGALLGIQKIAGRIVDRLARSSPMLAGILSLFKHSLMLFFRPFGDFLGTLLRPLAIVMLRAAVKWLKFAKTEKGQDVIETLVDAGIGAGIGASIGAVVGTILGAAAGPLGMAIGALVGAFTGAGIGAAITALPEVWAGIKFLFGALSDWVDFFINKIFGIDMDGVRVAVVDFVYNKMIPFFKGMGKIINTALNPIELAKLIWSGITKIWEWTHDVGGWLWDKITSIWNWGQDVGMWLWEKIKSIWNWDGDVSTWLWEKIKMIWNWTEDLSSWLWEKVKTIWNWTGDIASWLWEKIKTIWNWTNDFGTWLWEQVQSVWNYTADFGTWLWDQVKTVWNYAEDLGTWLWNKLTNVWNYASDFGTFLWTQLEKVWNYGEDFGDWLWGKLKNVWNYAENLGSWLWDKLKTIWTWSSTWNIGQLIWDKIQSIISSIVIPRVFGGGHQTGLNSVPETGLYQLHKGEEVVTAPRAQRTGKSNISITNVFNIGGSGTTQVIDMESSVRRASRLSELELRSRGLA